MLPQLIQLEMLIVVFLWLEYYLHMQDKLLTFHQYDISLYLVLVL